MRTTINLEPDVLAAARDIARTEKISVGKVISHWVRNVSTQSAGNAPAAALPASATGFQLFPVRGAIVTDELIDRLRNAEASEIAAPVALSSGGTPVGQVVLDDRGCF